MSREVILCVYITSFEDHNASMRWQCSNSYEGRKKTYQDFVDGNYAGLQESDDVEGVDDSCRRISRRKLSCDMHIMTMPVGHTASNTRWLLHLERSASMRANMLDLRVQKSKMHIIL
jgi:hypothetical protein